jgi:hypothetical protein
MGIGSEWTQQLEELNMKLHRHVLFPILLTISACGTMPEERAASGAGIGAATGAIVGAVTSLAVGPGALIGALGGGLVGAMTNKDQVNMGEPVWKQGRTSANSEAPAELPAKATPVPGPDRETVAGIQRRLNYLGYKPGPVDGIYGRQTAQAIRAFQKDHGLEVDGQISTALADRMLLAPRNPAFSI